MTYKLTVRELLAAVVAFLFCTVPLTHISAQITGGPPEDERLENPLGEDSTLESFFFAILDVILVLAVPIIVFFIIYAGFLYVTAGGSEDKIKKATTAFTWAVVGGVLILGAYVLADVIENTIKAFQ